MSYKKVIYSVLAIVLVLSGGLGFSRLNKSKEAEAVVVTEAADADVSQYSRTDIAMGTAVTENIYSSGEDITAGIIDVLTEIENQYISWRVDNSEIMQVNRDAGGTQGTVISDKTAKYLEQSFKLSEDSGGAFDPTVGKITRLWDIDGEKPHVPEATEIKELLAAAGYEKVKISGTTVKLPQGSSIDLGAVGKGIGCDEAKKLLDETDGVHGAVISVGGSILVYGNKPDGEPWKVAVTDPRDADAFLGVLKLEGEHYVSTSGDYEKYFMEDGVRYHHILDPHTGSPAKSDLISVTVLCDNGLLSDGLSTACFVLGRGKSVALLERYNAEAVFVDADKNVYLTEGIKQYFTLTGEGYQEADSGE